MITLSEIVDNNLLSEELTKMLPTKCRCGSQILLTESLTEIVCSNPTCVYNIASRLAKMTSQLGLKSWDEKDCNEICSQFKFSSPFQIFLIKQLHDNNINVNIIDFSQKIKDIEEIKNKEIELWKIVKLANIRYISTVAEKLFGNYDSMDKALEDLEKGQVTFISEKLGIKNDEPSVISILIYDKIIEHKEELLFAETQFNIKKYTNNPLKIAITGNVKDFINKSEFIKSINNRYNKIRVVLDANISDDTKVLIVDGEINTAKYRYAKRINERYVKDCLDKDLFKYGDITKYKSNKDLLAIGEQIAILDSKSFIKRLDMIYGK